MATDSKCTLDNMYKTVLSIANIESEQFYSPLIYETHFNAVTSFLISELAKTYPYSQPNMDMLLPFMAFKKIPVQNGFFNLPDDYRNMLGNPYISIKPDGSDCTGIQIRTESEFKASSLKAGCKTRPVVMKERGEWDYLVTSTYKFPTYDNPIGQYVGALSGNDKDVTKIQVCPYDISTVYLLYVKKEKSYVYGYIQQPDDTFLFDPTTTIESEWNSNAFTPLLNGLMALYSAYDKNPELTNFSLLLSQKGIL